MPPTSLDSQYCEIKNGGKGYSLFDEIDHLDESGLRTEYPHIYNRIITAARDLGITRDSKSARSQRLVQHQVYIKRRRRAVSLPTTASTSNPVDGGQGAAQATQFDLLKFAFDAGDNKGLQDYVPELQAHNSSSSSQLRRLASSTPYPPTLKVPANTKGNIRAHPVLLFRAFEPAHGLRARRYVDDYNIPSPPPSGTAAFKALVWPHLQRSIHCDSAFISLAQNSRNALRRVELEHSRDGSRRSFAIFSFDAIVQSAEERFGSGNGIYLVSSFFGKDDISDLPDGYQGAGEWLIYGSIDCTPIAVLPCDQAIKLAKALLRSKKPDKECLNDIRECLSTVPSLWKQVVAYELLLRYARKNNIPAPNTPQYAELMCEIYRNDKMNNDGTDLVVQKYIDYQWVDSSDVVDRDELEKEDNGLQNDSHRTDRLVTEGLLNALANGRLDIEDELSTRTHICTRPAAYGTARPRSQHTPHTSKVDRGCNSIFDTDVDWDPSEDEAFFEAEFPSASKKRIYTTNNSSESPDHAIPSIEHSTSPRRSAANMITKATQIVRPPITSTPPQLRQRIAFRLSKTGTPTAVYSSSSSTSTVLEAQSQKLSFFVHDEDKRKPSIKPENVIDLTLDDENTTISLYNQYNNNRDEGQRRPTPVLQPQSYRNLHCPTCQHCEIQEPNSNGKAVLALPSAPLVAYPDSDSDSDSDMDDK